MSTAQAVLRRFRPKRSTNKRKDFSGDVCQVPRGSRGRVAARDRLPRTPSQRVGATVLCRGSEGREAHLTISRIGRGDSTGHPEAYTPEVSVFARSEEHTSELQSPLNLVCR